MAGSAEEEREGEGEASSEAGRHAQEECEKRAGCRGRWIARGRPTERLRERVLDPVG